VDLGLRLGGRRRLLLAGWLWQAPLLPHRTESIIRVGEVSLTT
jgi:hypothetical protein